MARSSAKMGVIGLLMVLTVVIFIGMVFFNKKSVVMGFEDIPTASMCEEGVKPCPEGFFCQSKACVPIYPKMNIDTVNGF